jgi:hypothetical protein
VNGQAFAPFAMSQSLVDFTTPFCVLNVQPGISSYPEN